MKRILLTLSIFISHLGFSQNFDYSQLDSFLGKYVSLQGNVYYKSISSDVLNPILNQFVKSSPKETWTKEEKLSYWINAYNIFTIKLISDNYPVKSIKDIKQPWDKKFIPIDGKLLSLNQIEHDIIRKMNEPRIHFALVCAAVSCPKLYNKAFIPENLDKDLTKLTKEFLEDTIKNSIAEEHVEISKIFQWFTGDFKTKELSLIDFLNLYTDIQISAKAKVKFKEYNWSLNE
jgi:hypothetical protein